jgi:DNA-binding PadR family transcriptional regulator
MPRRPNISAQTRLVLDTFLRQPSGWRYGFDLARETGLKSGTLYPLLIRLHEQGLLDAEWRIPAQGGGRGPRHSYRLSDSGLAFARTSAIPDLPQTRQALPA